MSRFPEPVLPSNDVFNERKQRQKNLIKASLYGVLLRALVIIIELAGVVTFHSSALLVDAVASLMDIAATLFLIFCIRLASKPPDLNHPFGHGRYEPLAGLQLGLLLALLGGMLVFQQVSSLVSHDDSIPMNSYAWIIPVFAILLLEVGYRQAMRVAKKHDSPALAADAWHYRVDALNSLVAMIALGAGSIMPAWSVDLDFLGALIIAALMIVIGIQAARSNMHQLLDRVPEERFFDLVNSAAKRIPGVAETEKVRIQQYGPDAHVDIDVEVDPAMSVQEAHRISQLVRAEIQKDWPAVRDVMVHIEPYYPNDH